MENYKSEEFEDELERQKRENQIKRLKLRLEYGGDFPIESDHDDLSPFVENRFLNNVLAFEKACDQSERVTIYDFIGQPKYRKAESITNEEIKSQLEWIMKLLNKNQIILDTHCVIDDRELYRFITEELFFIETDDVKMDGWISHFTYEEFHPNHEYDLRNCCSCFFESFLNTDSDFYTSHFTKEAGENNWFTNFRKSFKSFLVNNFKIIDVQYNEMFAKVHFDIDFFGIIEDSSDIVHFSGLGEMNFQFQWGFWYIQEMTLPPCME
jgi:hypothetical protein